MSPEYLSSQDTEETDQLSELGLRAHRILDGVSTFIEQMKDEGLAKYNHVLLRFGNYPDPICRVTQRSTSLTYEMEIIDGKSLRPVQLIRFNKFSDKKILEETGDVLSFLPSRIPGIVLDRSTQGSPQDDQEIYYFFESGGMIKKVTGLNEYEEDEHDNDSTSKLFNRIREDTTQAPVNPDDVVEVKKALSAFEDNRRFDLSAE